MKRFLLLFILAATGKIFAQTPKDLPLSSIEGIAPGKAGKAISAWIIDDYITRNERKLAETTVNDSNRFALHFELPATSAVYLRCDKVKGMIFAEPNRSLLVEMPGRDSLTMLNPNLEYEADVTFFNDDSTEMNNLATKYNARFVKFWGNNIIYLYHQRENFRRLDSFRLAVHKDYANIPNPYFRSWVDYSLAALIDASYNTEKYLYENFLQKKPILYGNDEYMNFFNGFFKDYVFTSTILREGEKIKPAINVTGTRDALMEALKPVRWLGESDTLRELVMLKGLYELYNNPNFEPRNILAIAEQTAVQSKIAEHRKIARNIIAAYTSLTVGTPAKGFSAVNVKGNMVTPLEDFKGKYIFLHFYTTWNAHALQEMKLLPDLQKKYGKRVQFVSVSLDDDTAAYRKFIKDNPKYNWTMLHYHFNEQLKDDYQLLAYPAYFIIDEEGKFYQAPASSPTDELEYILWRINNPRKTEMPKIPGTR